MGPPDHDRSPTFPGETISPLAAALRAAVENDAKGVSALSVLFSGGLDSSLVAWLVPRNVEVELATVGLPGSSDLEVASEAAERINLPWKGVELTSDDVLKTATALGLQRSSGDGTSVQVALALALEATTHRRVIVGQGADELFFGYAHFRGLDGNELQEARLIDLERLDSRDWPRTEAIARQRGRELRSPYLAPTLRTAALALPLPDLRTGGEMKPALREIARRLGLPAELTDRRKRAIQFGTGIDRLLRRRMN